MTHTASFTPAGTEARVRALEERIAALAAALERLPDPRLGTANAATEDLLAVLTRLTAEIARRESSPDWDAVDHLATRVMLRTLASIAGELRRALSEGASALDTADSLSNKATDLVNRLSRELSTDPRREE